jgi:hypothetical protein
VHIGGQNQMDKTELIWKLADSLEPKQWSWLASLVCVPCPRIQRDKIALLKRLAGILYPTVRVES